MLCKSRKIGVYISVLCELNADNVKSRIFFCPTQLKKLNMKIPILPESKY